MANMPQEADTRRLHAVAYGLVQGVNFRAYTVRRAHSLGLKGWVRNRADGAVEVVAEGSPKALESLLSFLHDGPPSARVTEVEAKWEPATGEFNEFRVRY